MQLLVGQFPGRTQGRRRIGSIVLVLAWLFAGCSSIREAPHFASEPPLTPALRREVGDALVARLRAAYVSLNDAELAGKGLAARLEAQAYDTTDRGAFAARLTSDLQDVTHDKHLRVSERVEPPPLRDTRHPVVFGRVENVAGVAYVQVVSFGVPPDRAREEIARTMSSVADARALVLDLTENGGGHPGTVALLASYLFGEEKVHLNTMVDRAQGVQVESFTDPRVAGRKLGPQKPVFVIIGPRTFSGAEEFTYDLQAIGRVAVVGETSGGGAHSGRFEPLPGGFSAFVPSKRPINPVTRTNWEGVGVVPDVRTSSELARPTAMKLAAERANVELSGTVIPPP